MVPVNMLRWFVSSAILNAQLDYKHNQKPGVQIYFEFPTFTFKVANSEFSSVCVAADGQ